LLDRKPERGYVTFSAHISATPTPVAPFQERDWDLWDEPWLRERLAKMATLGYENQVSAVVAKLLLRGKA
jgi:hypothetical protein